MPNPGTKPPTKRIEEISTIITFDLWEMFKDEPSKSKDELHARDSKMIEFLIKELAKEREKIELIINVLEK